MSGRILVTGAAGFIGSHVVKQLAATGIAVRATTRKPEGAGFLKEMGDMEIVKMDLLDVGSVKAAVEGCQDIIHCAAELYIASKVFLSAIALYSSKSVIRSFTDRCLKTNREVACVLSTVLKSAGR